MKKIISALLVTAFWCVNLSDIVRAENTQRIIYVSPSGADTAPGTIDEPLKTLAGARDLIREIKSSGNLDGGIKVMFREGRYEWSDTVSFSAYDSGTEEAPVIYCSYPGEKAVFDGGIEVSAKELVRVSDTEYKDWFSEAEYIYCFNIAEKLEENGYSADVCYNANTNADTYNHFGSASIDGNGCKRQPVYSFGENTALWVARYPDKSGGNFAPQNPQQQFIKITDVSGGDSSEPIIINYSDEKISEFSEEDAFIYGYIGNNYFPEYKRVKIDSENKTITSVDNMSYGSASAHTNGQQRMFFVYNILSELDSSGEYFIDKDTGMMYVYPNADIRENDLNISVFSEDYMIKMNKTSNIVFSGIEFKNCQGGAVKCLYGSNIRFEYCTFNNFGVNAVQIGENLNWNLTGNPYSKNWLNVEEGFRAALYNYFSEETSYTNFSGNSKNSGLYSCFINNIGSTGVFMYGGNVYKGVMADDYIENCKITNTSLYKTSYAGAARLCGSGFRIKNNEFAHSAGSIFGADNYVTDLIFDGNEVYNAMTEGTDNGFIYMNYQEPNLNLKFINNYFHDGPFDTEVIDEKSYIGQRSVIYLDNDMAGGGVEISGNVFANVQSSFINVKENNVYKNNVFIDCFVALPHHRKNWPQLTWDEKKFSECDDYPQESGLYHNIAYLPVFEEGEEYDELRRIWRKRYPSFMEWAEIKESGEADNVFYADISNNLSVNSKIPCASFETNQNVDYNNLEMYDGASRSKGENNNFITDTKVFEDYENNDFRLTEVAIEKYGLEFIDMDNIGLADTNVGAENYSKNNSALENSGKYSENSIVYINGNIEKSNKPVTVKIEKEGKVLYVNQVCTDKNGEYSLKFEVSEEYHGADVSVWAEGEKINNKIYVVENKYKALKPEFTVKNDNKTVGLKIDNIYDIEDYTYCFAAASYDENGRLSGIITSDKKTVKSTGVTEDEFLIEALDKTRKIKVFLWNDIQGVVPLTDVIVLSDER